MQIHTYLFFNGNCREAFEFYERHLGGKIAAMMTWGEGPMKDNVPPEQRNIIMHGSVNLGGHLLMGSDTTEPEQYKGITGARIVFSANEPEEAERVFRILSEEGRAEMALQETFFAQRFGMLVDRFGVSWMVLCDKEGE